MKWREYGWSIFNSQRESLQKNCESWCTAKWNYTIPTPYDTNSYLLSTPYHSNSNRSKSPADRYLKLYFSTSLTVSGKRWLSVIQWVSPSKHMALPSLGTRPIIVVSNCGLDFLKMEGGDMGLYFDATFLYRTTNQLWFSLIWNWRFHPRAGISLRVESTLFSRIVRQRLQVNCSSIMILSFCNRMGRPVVLSGSLEPLRRLKYSWNGYLHCCGFLQCELTCF